MDKKIKISAKRLLIFLLVFSSLIPNIGINISAFGFYWTLYRTSVLLGIIIYLQMPKNVGRTIVRSVYRKWTILMGVWLLYGALLLPLSPYKDLHKGFVELLSVFNGAACVYILVSIIQEKADVEQISSIIFHVYVALVLVGLYEIATGYHLPMSYFHDQTVTHLSSRIAATGVFYNENDFSAFLTCFAPIMLYKKRRWIIGVPCIVATVYIDYVNDANICLIAMIASILFFVVFLMKYGKNGRQAQGILRFVITGLIVIMAYFIWKNLDEISNSISLLNVIRTQRLNAVSSQGSFYMRMTMYKDSVRAARDTYFIGIGPAAFSNYFIAHPSASGLINPHNLYLEVLVEYGLVIFGGFTFGLFKLISAIRNRVLLCGEYLIRRRLVVGCEILVLYGIVCIVPSTFVGYAWQWIVIVFGIVMAGIPENELA